MVTAQRAHYTDGKKGESLFK